MASLQDIRRRIKSVKSIQQITKAMKMVAAARLRRAQQAAVANKPYADKMAEIVENAASRVGKFRHPLLKVHKGEKELYLVIASDKGLAGAYASNIFKEVVPHIPDKEKADLVAIGRKTVEHFTNRGYNVVNKYLGISERPTFEWAKQIAEDIADRYESGEYRAVYLVYSRFVSAITTVPETIQLLPFSQLVDQKAVMAEMTKVAKEAAVVPTMKLERVGSKKTLNQVNLTVKYNKLQDEAEKEADEDEINPEIVEDEDEADEIERDEDVDEEEAEEEENLEVEDDEDEEDSDDDDEGNDEEESDEDDEAEDDGDDDEKESDDDEADDGDDDDDDEMEEDDGAPLGPLSPLPPLEPLPPMDDEFPFEEDPFAEDEGEQYIFEPSAANVLNQLLPQYLITMIYGAQLQAAASELSSRMTAMSNATDNAEELIKKLDLHYNKVRQAKITSEISEIVGGAEALK